MLLFIHLLSGIAKHLSRNELEEQTLTLWDTWGHGGYIPLVHIVSDFERLLASSYCQCEIGDFDNEESALYAFLVTTDRVAHEELPPVRHCKYKELFLFNK